jgi:hypothetical protein
MTKIYPFKFLDAYQKQDKDIFFGREEETKQLYDLVHQSKMVWLYGASGTGKTSLIDCGLANLFKSYDWKAFFIRRGDNFNYSLDKTLCEASEGEFVFDKDKVLMNLPEKLETVHIIALSPVYLIFDQFEELYILGSKAEKEEFINAVKQIYASPLPVKLLFSIREEYLGSLYEFEKAVPELLRKKLRVEPMNLDKVRQILEGIDKNTQTNVKLQAEEKSQITEAIFQKIQGEEKTLFIQLPYLQVFLDKLYRQITQDESHQKEAVFDLASLQKIGDISNVLRDFLEEQVLRIAQKSQQTAENIWQVLSPLATLEGTKEPLSLSALQAKLPQMSPEVLTATIQEFVNARILRYTEKDELYEVVHDTLAKQIAGKRSDEEIALLEVQRLIKTQTLAPTEVREYFSEKQLLFIEPFLPKLSLEEEQKKWLAQSQVHLQAQKDASNRIKTKRQLQVMWLVLFAGLIAISWSILLFWQFERAQKALQKAEESIQKFKKEERQRIMAKIRTFENIKKTLESNGETEGVKIYEDSISVEKNKLKEKSKDLKK